MQGKVLLDLRKISKYFGALHAVENVSFMIREGQIISLIGPNGAGKTTIINLITGYYPTTSGQIIFDNNDVTGLPEFKLCRMGMARTFQKIKLFKKISVLDNVMIAMYSRTKSRLLAGILRTKSERKEEIECIKESLEQLHYVGIEKYWDLKAQELSYGDQRRLEIARALATHPKLLLLDEPVAGMNPQEKIEMISLIRDIQSKGYSILLIEHDMNLVMDVSDYVVVVDHGIKIAEGTPNEIQSNQLVIEAYLGKGDTTDEHSES